MASDDPSQAGTSSPTKQPRSQHSRASASAPSSPLMVVGLGASAGGLAALRRLLSHVPEDTGIAFVVVVHLSPERGSMMADLLAPYARMPVRQVSGPTPIEPNQVYVIPPGHNIDTLDTHLRLSELEERPIERAPIDHFLSTLARTHEHHAVAVILTGTGSDGALGIKEIEERGGLVIVQDPDEAEFDGMPRSAIATGLPHRVLPLAEIPPYLVEFARIRPQLPDDEDGGTREMKPLLQKVFDQIRARTGREFGAYKHSTLLRRIRRRMQMARVEELADYVQILQRDAGEARQLADDLLITVTSFFRDEDVFKRLEQDVVPRLFEGKGPQGQVRAWSVACATGEEAYSVAMLLAEEASARDAPPGVQVFASDLHEPSIRVGRAGFYPGEITTHVPAERLRRFFVQEERGYRIRKEIRELVVFAPQNVLADPPFSKLDLIVCRNLLIYLRRDIQRDLIALFHYALQPDGFLVVGTSETVDGADLFHVESKPHGVYRRRNVTASEPRFPVFSSAATKAELPAETAGASPPRGSMGAEALHRHLTERHASPSVLVSPDQKVVHVSGLAGRFLNHPPGEVTSHVSRLVREELRAELLAALHAARGGRRSWRSQPLAVPADGTTGWVVLSVHPASEPPYQGFALVVFEPVEAPPGRRGESSGAGGRPEDARLREVKTELDLTKQRLQTVLEEYEGSRAEMQASNEELQSMNEELQTLNQENRHKVEELAHLSADLQNLLVAADIATIFLDRELRILRLTPQAADLFNARPIDLGRPLADLTHRMIDTDLLADAREVLRSLTPLEREVQNDEGRWYLARTRPYRSAEDRIEGVVLTFVDITRRKESEDALRRMAESLERRVEERTQQVRQLATTLTRAEREERVRISHVLHDELQQILTGVQAKLAAVRRRVGQEPDRLAAGLDEIREWMGRAISATRRLTEELQPPVLQSERLDDTLAWLRHHMRSLHHLDVELDLEPSVHVAQEEVRIVLFESVRELLFNVVKHARTDRASVAMRGGADRGGITIDVRDEGVGFDPTLSAHRPLGLARARERLDLFGGHLEIEAAPGAGTRVRIHLPLGP